MLRSIPFVLVLLFTSVGCASTVQYVPFPKRSLEMPPDTSRIYVMRPSSLGSTRPGLDRRQPRGSGTCSAPGATRPSGSSASPTGSPRSAPTLRSTPP